MTVLYTLLLFNRIRDLTANVTVAGPSRVECIPNEHVMQVNLFRCELWKRCKRLQNVEYSLTSCSALENLQYR